MNAPVSVFFDFNLPNGTTWFYFSWLLAVALFFKFSRFLSMRNWDVVTLFLLVPGLLIIQGTRANPTPSSEHPAVQIASVIGQGSGHALGAAPSNVAAVGQFGQSRDPSLVSGRWLWWGYLWLLCGTAYFLLRCLLDLTLVQKPALGPNLSFGGLAWLAGALAVCLIAVAFRPYEPPQTRALTPPNGKPNLVNVHGPTTTVGPESATLGQIREQIGARFWLLRGFAVLGHLAVVFGLIFIGRWHFQDTAAGMAAATFYLLLPYTGLYVGQAHHVWPMALVLWSIATYKTPTLAGALLGLAAGTMYFPAVLLPIWVSFYWKRGAGRFLLFFLASVVVSLTIIGLSLWLQGDLESSVREAFSQAAWQPWKEPKTEGFWRDVPTPYRIPIFLLYAAFVILTAVWPWPKNLAHVIALSAGVLIGIQFWYADQGGVYVLWYLPLLLLLVFRPNLEDRRPPQINVETDWLARWKQALGRLVRWMGRKPEPVGSNETLARRASEGGRVARGNESLAPNLRGIAR
ncbi:MAG: hypothetical protein L0Y72_07030 [Gemmataceae bacterium]|nr:hypothetical protein [Gemmataceae bacterium]MCI0738779.1 hypothetical protein [Gemmataceae bacterium]